MLPEWNNFINPKPADDKGRKVIKELKPVNQPAAATLKL